MEQLKTLYAEYHQKVTDLRQKAHFFDGIMGFGDDPKKDPCHEAFYHAVKNWVEAFAATCPSPEDANEVASFLIEAPAHNREAESYWFMYANMVFIEALIPYINSIYAKALAKRMNFLFPRYDRMPAHQAVYKKLQQAGK